MIISLAINQYQPRLYDLEWTVNPARMSMDASALVMCGDGATLAISYMETYEFVRLIARKELDVNMMRLRNMSQWAYLILGGYFRSNGNRRVEAGGHISQMSIEAVEGAMLSVQEHGVSLLQIGKVNQLPGTIDMLAKRKRADKRIKPPRDAIFMEPEEDLLTSLPGIGPERAQTVLDYCGNAAWSLVALTDDTSAIPGIGEETRKKIRSALGLGDDMHFSVWTTEGKDEK